MTHRNTRAQPLLVWLAGLTGFFFLPWYGQEDGLFDLGWVAYYPLDPETAPAPIQALRFGRVWLLALLLPLALPALTLAGRGSQRFCGLVFGISGLLGIVIFLIQGYAITSLGLSSPALSAMFPNFAGRQFGAGAGAVVVLSVLVLFCGRGAANLGAFRGDVFVASVFVGVLALVLLFIVWPVAGILLLGVEAEDGSRSLAPLLLHLSSPKLWSGAGVAVHSLILAVLSGAGTTILGLMLALAATRTRFSRWKIFSLLSVLPIITPPFVLGMALILLFGRSGAITSRLAELFGVPTSRGIYGLGGVLLAQLLAFTPIAFLILSGALRALSPTLEEAAETLRASAERRFFTVVLPLLRPALASAFLLGFIESLADFGNPLVLGGSDFEVLSTEIYFAVAGAEANIPKASAMTLVLLSFTLLAFYAQHRFVGRAGYVSVQGKGDVGIVRSLPPLVAKISMAVALIFLMFTVLVYGVIFFGGFAETLGRGAGLTLSHYRNVFGLTFEPDGGLLPITFVGGAWRSLFSSLLLAAVAAPLTAAFGILTAYLLARQQFIGRDAFELLTMLSFAVPGTVIGVSYVLAFNAPPFELTGTTWILLLAFLFRNMPVGIRAGISALAQIDKSLDEASMVLGAGTPRTLSWVIFPLMKPAIITAMVYGFARAMTAVSAVVFLVSAEHSLATTYILGRVEAGDYGSAIAYASTLILLMAAVIAGIQRGVGRTEISRRAAA